MYLNWTRWTELSLQQTFEPLIDNNMKKKDLCEKAGISSSAIVKMGRQESVYVELISKTCLAFGCAADVVLEFFPDKEKL